VRTVIKIFVLETVACECQCIGTHAISHETVRWRLNVINIGQEDVAGSACSGIMPTATDATHDVHACECT